jgi:hypothetical protein
MLHGSGGGGERCAEIEQRIGQRPDQFVRVRRLKALERVFQIPGESPNADQHSGLGKFLADLPAHDFGVREGERRNGRNTTYIIGGRFDHAEQTVGGGIHREGDGGEAGLFEELGEHGGGDLIGFIVSGKAENAAGGGLRG